MNIWAGQCFYSPCTSVKTLESALDLNGAIYQGYHHNSSLLRNHSPPTLLSRVYVMTAKACAVSKAISGKEVLQEVLFAACHGLKTFMSSVKWITGSGRVIKRHLWIFTLQRSCKRPWRSLFCSWNKIVMETKQFSQMCGWNGTKCNKVNTLISWQGQI